MSHLVSLDSVRHRYDSGLEIVLPDIVLDAGGSMMVLGKSGVGKTTLLHIISGLLRPTNGVVKIQDQDIYKLEGTDLDRFRGENIGVIFQKPHFFSSLTAIENLQLSATFQSKKVKPAFIDQVLNRLDIADKARSMINELSQGQLQRLSIARACISRPKLILADEPTSALDDDNAVAVMNLLREMQHEVDAGLMIVTHDSRIKSKVDQIVDLSSTTQLMKE